MSCSLPSPPSIVLSNSKYCLQFYSCSQNLSGTNLLESLWAYQYWHLNATPLAKVFKSRRVQNQSFSIWTWAFKIEASDSHLHWSFSYLEFGFLFCLLGTWKISNTLKRQHFHTALLEYISGYCFNTLARVQAFFAQNWGRAHSLPELQHKEMIYLRRWWIFILGAIIEVRASTHRSSHANLTRFLGNLQLLQIHRLLHSAPGKALTADSMLIHCSMNK